VLIGNTIEINSQTSCRCWLYSNRKWKDWLYFQIFTEISKNKPQYLSSFNLWHWWKWIV